jgi:hypothetical protein
MVVKGKGLREKQFVSLSKQRAHKNADWPRRHKEHRAESQRMEELGGHTSTGSLEEVTRLDMEVEESNSRLPQKYCFVNNKIKLLD